MKHFCTHTLKLCIYIVYIHLIYIYMFWFNRLKFRFWIFENYEKKGACFLSSSQELAGVPLSLCVSYSTVNHSLLVPWGGTKGPLRPFIPTQCQLKVSPGTAHNSLSGKAPLATLVEMRRLQGGNRKSKSSCVINRICVMGTERMWAMLQPLAQNNNPMPRSLTWLSCPPVSPPTQNLNTWAKHFQRVSAQTLCTCPNSHSACIRASALKMHPRPTFMWSVGAADLRLAHAKVPILKEKISLKNVNPLGLSQLWYKLKLLQAKHILSWNFSTSLISSKM